MAFEWADYLRLAKALQDSSDEAKCRTAVSRAYYAAFNSARAAASQIGVDVTQVSETNQHNSTWLAYRTARTMPIAELGQRLKTERVKADYELIVPEGSWENRAEVAVGLAERLLGHLQKLRSQGS